MIAGMMGAALLHGEGVVDLSFGFPRGGLAEGALMAIIGASAGYAVLFAVRKLRNIVNRSTK